MMFNVGGLSTKGLTHVIQPDVHPTLLQFGGSLKKWNDAWGKGKFARNVNKFLSYSDISLYSQIFLLTVDKTSTIWLRNGPRFELNRDRIDPKKDTI